MSTLFASGPNCAVEARAFPTPEYGIFHPANPPADSDAPPIPVTRGDRADHAGHEVRNHLPARARAPAQRRLLAHIDCAPDLEIFAAHPDFVAIGIAHLRPAIALSQHHHRQSRALIEPRDPLIGARTLAAFHVITPHAHEARRLIRRRGAQ